jgi:hypothetical protein
VKGDEKPVELPPAFKPFIAAQAINPIASSIAQRTKMRDLIPAFKPFVASEAIRSHVRAINATNFALSKIIADRSALSKLFADKAVVSNISGPAKVLGSIQPTTPSLLKSMSATSVLARQVEESRRMEHDLSEMWSAQARRKADVEQAALDSANGTSALVEVAHKQETVLESTAYLVARLVEEQHQSVEMERRASRINRRWLVSGIAIATISAAASVLNVIVHWHH